MGWSNRICMESVEGNYLDGLVISKCYLYLPEVAAIKCEHLAKRRCYVIADAWHLARPGEFNALLAVTPVIPLAFLHKDFAMVTHFLTWLLVSCASSEIFYLSTCRPARTFTSLSDHNAPSVVRPPTQANE